MNLKFPFQKITPDFSNLKDNPDTDYEFSKAIDLFSSQRRKLGISLEDLSNKTKISKNVLTAIENGWKKYLPEGTYLISMIKKIESELSLESGSLKGLLLKKVSNKKSSRLKFRIINIASLNNWEVSLLYILLMFLSILAINSQQKYLLLINSKSTEPIFLNETHNKENKSHDYNVEKF